MKTSEEIRKARLKRQRARAEADRIGRICAERAERDIARMMTENRTPK